MQKVILTLAFIIGLTSLVLYHQYSSKDQHDFELFKNQFKKTYLKQGEEEYRKIIYKQNVNKIEQHNADPSTTYIQGVNRFTDLTFPEFEAQYLNLQFSNIPNHQISQAPSKVGVNIDWSAAGKVSVVKDQGQCGSSWAFSATGAIESAYIIKGHNILVSEQQLLDCSGDYGNQGCNGGFMSASFKYVKEKKIHQSKDYPYVGKYQTCKQVGGQTWGLSNYVDVKGCEGVINALSLGPVSIAVDASTFSTYKSGILTKCGTSANHGSLVVGVTDAYWKLKQAWGTNWGESGFIRIAKGAGSGNACAICDIPSYPIV